MTQLFAPLRGAAARPARVPVVGATPRGSGVATDFGIRRDRAPQGPGKSGRRAGGTLPAHAAGPRLSGREPHLRHRPPHGREVAPRTSAHWHTEEGAGTARRGGGAFCAVPVSVRGGPCPPRRPARPGSALRPRTPHTPLSGRLPPATVHQTPVIVISERPRQPPDRAFPATGRTTSSSARTGSRPSAHRSSAPLATSCSSSLLRRCFPQGTDPSVHSPGHPASATGLNDRPRRTLGRENPAERLHTLLAA